MMYYFLEAIKRCSFLPGCIALITSADTSVYLNNSPKLLKNSFNNSGSLSLYTNIICVSLLVKASNVSIKSFMKS